MGRKVIEIYYCDNCNKEMQEHELLVRRVVKWDTITDAAGQSEQRFAHVSLCRGCDANYVRELEKFAGTDAIKSIFGKLFNKTMIVE